MTFTIRASALLASALVLGGCHRPGAEGAAVKAAPAAAARAVPVLAATARKGDLGIYLTGLGSAKAFNQVALHSRVDGELVNVAFTEGQLVKEGDLLCEIDPRPYQVELENAEGKLDQDTANHRNAQINLERFQQAKDAISQQQIDTMLSTVSQFAGALKSDQAAIDQAKLNLAYCRITAPITGRIGLRLVDKGNIVRATDAQPLAVITQLQPIAVVFALPQDDLIEVVKKPRMGEGLPVEVFDRDLKKKLATGSLLTFDNQIDPASGTVKFKAVCPNADGALFPNQFVNARLLVETRKDVILVPQAAVQRSPKTTFVYVVKADETVEQRSVVTGPSEGDETIVESGLDAGEVVVTEGVDKLQAGAKVSVPKPKEKADKSEKAAKGERAEKSRP